MHGARRSWARSDSSPSTRLQQRGEGGVADLAGQCVEEAVELVEVAVGDGQEVRRVGLVGAGAADLLDVELELVAEALHAPAHAHEVAALEAPGQDVGVAERPRRRSCPVRSRSSSAR